jgi:hypothetical protein
LLVLMLAVIGTQTLRLHKEQKSHAADRTEWAIARAQSAEAAASAQAAYRNQESEWRASQDEIARNAEKAVQQARNDAADASAAARGLRQQVAAVVASDRRRAAARPSASASGPAASDTEDLLAGLFLSAVDRARELAAIADERGAAGVACERAYRSIAGPVTPSD